MNWLLLLLAFLVVPSYNMIPEKPEPKTLIVYATGNLKDALDSAATYFERSNPDWKVKYHFGASEELVQLADGRLPVDVLIISDQENVDTLKEQGVVDGPITPFISDHVVIILDAQSEYDVREVKDLVMGEEIKRFALSGEKTPLGISAREYLKKLGLEELPTEKLVNAKNPRACVAAVKSGEAKWTFCYSSDAAANKKKLKVLFMIPPSEMPPIDYYKIILKGSKNHEAAQRYMDTLDSTISRMLFDNQGYTLLTGAQQQPQTRVAQLPGTESTGTQTRGTQTSSTHTSSTQTSLTQSRPTQTSSTQTQTAPTKKKKKNKPH